MITQYTRIMEVVEYERRVFLIVCISLLPDREGTFTENSPGGQITWADSDCLARIVLC